MSRQSRSSYSLQAVYDAVENGKVTVNGNALSDARSLFGWETEDIARAILGLRPRDFHKTEPSKFLAGVMLDVYKARNLMGENVYTHFYMNSGRLIINSFKQI